MDPSGIEEQGSEIVEPDGTKVEFCHRLGIRVSRDSVDAGTRHGWRGTVLESTTVVNAVVAETAKIGVAENGFLIAEVMACRRAEPERVVAVDGKQHAEIA